MLNLALTTLVVGDYDEAIAYYVDRLGFTLLEDRPVAVDKRWVVVGPQPAGGSGLLLARASNESQRERIGDQTGGRVFLFLLTDDFDADHVRLSAAGVSFKEPPREEAYGKVAVFADLYGNLWDLLQLH